MRPLLATGALLACCSFAFGAQGAPREAITATLAAPVAQETSIVAGGAIWRCEDTTCRVVSDNSLQEFQACRTLARKVGQVTAFGRESKPLAEARLAACNAK